MECPVCREHTESDPQTGRCMKCGRLPNQTPFEDMQMLRALARTPVSPPSPSAAYRAAQARSVPLSVPVVTSAIVPNGHFSPALAIRADGLLVEATDDHGQSDELYIYDSPTDRVVCATCGAITIWLRSEPSGAETPCGFCARDLDKAQVA